MNRRRKKELLNVQKVGPINYSSSVYHNACGARSGDPIQTSRRASLTYEVYERYKARTRLAKKRLPQLSTRCSRFITPSWTRRFPQAAPRKLLRWTGWPAMVRFHLHQQERLQRLVCSSSGVRCNFLNDLNISWLFFSYWLIGACQRVEIWCIVSLVLTLFRFGAGQTGERFSKSAFGAVGSSLHARPSARWNNASISVFHGCPQQPFLPLTSTWQAFGTTFKKTGFISPIGLSPSLTPWVHRRLDRPSTTGRALCWKFCDICWSHASDGLVRHGMERKVTFL